MEENQIAYLIESVDVTSKGKLHGKSLRTYEVEITSTAQHAPKFRSTGYMYTLENGELKKKATKASLDNKYISWNHRDEVHSKVTDSVPMYGCSLFASPMAALIAKTRAIESRIFEIERMLENNLAELRRNKPKLPLATLRETHPEYFV